MRSRVVVPIKVEVPGEVPEPLPAGENDFYAWLGGELAGWPAHVSEVPLTRYLTADESRDRPHMVAEYLDREYRRVRTDARDDAIVIIDLAGNPYHFLGERLLHHVATVGAGWAAASPRRIVAILLPRQPPPGSIVWDSLDQVRRQPAGKLVTITGDGAVRWSAGQPSTDLDLPEFRRRRLPNQESLRQQIDQRLVGKLGHFDFQSRAEPHCARYYFEAAHAEREIGDYVVAWARRDLPEDVLGERLTLLSHGRHSPWLHDAVTGAAAVLGCLLGQIDDDGTVRAGHRITGPVVLLVDVVHTGLTMRKLVDRIREQGLDLVPRALAVLVTDRELDRTRLPLSLDVICWRDRQKVVRSRCEQCRLGLSHTDRRQERPWGIRTYDMWDMMARSAWAKETYGPKEHYDHVPDMGDLCDNYGDWIAFRVATLVHGFRGPPVVFICPEETNVAKLTGRLKVLMQNRQVTIRIPRKAITKARSGRGQSARPAAGALWERQLRHLGNNRAGDIVLLDDHCGSGGTARALLALLGRYNLAPSTFIVIMDYAIDAPLGKVRKEPLYRIPYPRRNVPASGSRVPADEGSPEEACRSLVYHLLAYGPRWEAEPQAVRACHTSLLLADYARRCQDLPAAERSRLDRWIIDWFHHPVRATPEEFLVALAADGTPPEAGRAAHAPVDIAIITVIREELEATRDVFGCDENAYQPISGTVPGEQQRCYPTVVHNARHGDLSVVVTAAGEPHNAHMTLIVQRVRDTYRPRALFLVGIAAGNPEKLAVGDVVVPRKVHYYEPGRMTPHGAQPRPAQAQIADPYGYGLFHYNPDRTLPARVSAFLAGLPASPEGAAELVPRVVHGNATIASGELVLRDGVWLRELRSRFDETIYAADQESYGFAVAARGLRWAIFRGVSDHGDERQRDEWKYPAAGVAAVCLRDYLETEYLPPGAEEL